jgi:hypothetical protein
MIFKPIDIGPIIVALIGLAGTVYSLRKKQSERDGSAKNYHSTVLSISIFIIIVAIVIGGCLLLSRGKPNVAIDPEVNDITGTLVDKRAAPYQVVIKGTASNAGNLFCYLVVDDGNAEWIEPGLGKGIDGEFNGNCHLGIKDDPRSLNRQYVVFAVVTDKEHKEYEHLSRESRRAVSHRITLHRTN